MNFNKKQISTLFLLLFGLLSFSQDIKKHKWQERVLLIYSKNKNSEHIQNQISTLLEKKTELEDRKIIMYTISENQFRTNFSENWLPSNFNFAKYNKDNEDFQVVLIGLDGGVKIKQTTLLTTQKLFGLIDHMPMRRRELNSKQN
jgi:hypothetical protein